MAERWESGRSRDSRRMRSLQGYAAGIADGRVAQTAPVPKFDRQKQPSASTFVVYVQPNDPGYDDPSVWVTGTLWFDTDDASGGDA